MISLLSIIFRLFYFFDKNKSRLNNINLALITLVVIVIVSNISFESKLFVLKVFCSVSFTELLFSAIYCYFKVTNYDDENDELSRDFDANEYGKFRRDIIYLFLVDGIEFGVCFFVIVFIYYYRTIYPIYLIAILEPIKLWSVLFYLIPKYREIRYSKLKNFFLYNCRMKLVTGCGILLLYLYVLF